MTDRLTLRPCVWAVVVRRLRWDPTIEKYRVEAGPILDMRRARPRRCRRP